MDKIICLTDRPAIVTLKREFRELDEREQELKLAFAIGSAERCRDAVTELESVRQRKAAIAREIFQMEGALQ